MKAITRSAVGAGGADRWGGWAPGQNLPGIFPGTHTGREVCHGTQHKRRLNFHFWIMGLHNIVTFFFTVFLLLNFPENNLVYFCNEKET